MQRILLRSKIHRATVTATHLDYEGSITIDHALLEAADILPGEQVHALNLSNGSRFETYVIEGKEGGGEVALNGPAARLGEVGDKIIIVAYGLLDEAEVTKYQPKIIRVDGRNHRITS